GAGVRRGLGGVVPRRVPLRSVEAWPGADAGLVPAGPQLRQGEVRGQLAAAVPYRSAVPAGIVVQPDRVPGDLSGIAAAVPELDPHTGHLLEQREELLLAAGGGRRGGGVPSQSDPWRFGPAVPGGLLLLGPGRPPCRSTVAWRRHGQPVPLLSG